LKEKKHFCGQFFFPSAAETKELEIVVALSLLLQEIALKSLIKNGSGGSLGLRWPCFGLLGPISADFGLLLSFLLYLKVT